MSSATDTPEPPSLVLVYENGTLTDVGSNVAGLRVTVISMNPDAQRPANTTYAQQPAYAKIEQMYTFTDEICRKLAADARPLVTYEQGGAD